MRGGGLLFVIVLLAVACEGSGTAPGMEPGAPATSTWWVWVLGVLTLAGLVYGVHRLRVRGLEGRRRELARQVASRTRELAALKAITAVMSGSMDLDQILSGALDRVLAVTGLDGGGIFLLPAEAATAEGGMLRLAASRGIAALPEETSDPLGLGEELSARAIRRGEPLVVRDLDAHPGSRPKAVREQGYRSVALVPLISRGEVLGSLVVMSRGEESLSQQDVELLTSIGRQIGVAIENARLYEATEHRLAQVTTLQRTSTAVASTLELEELLTLITQQATSLLRASGGILNLVDWDKHEDEAVACAGLALAGLGGRSPLDASLSGWVTLRNRPVISNQVQGDTRVDRPGLARLERETEEEIRNAAVAPLTVKGQVMGTLAVINKERGETVFDEGDLDLLVAFANQAATAIENARLFKAEQRRAEQFRVISEVGRRVTSLLDRDGVLDQVASLVQRSFGYDHVGIALIEDGHAVYKVGAGELWERPSFEFRPARLKIGEEGITGWVAAHGEPLLVPDVTREPRYVLMEGSQTRSELALPITVKGQVVGVLDVQSKHPNAFDESDVVVLQSLADQAAVAIENARLFDAEQRRAEQFRVLGEVGRRITSILAVDELLSQMARLVREAFDYYGIGIGLVEGEEVVFRAGAGAFVDVIRAHDPLCLKVGEEGLTGWVAASGEPLVVPDVSKDPRYYYVPEVAETRSEVCVPLKAKGAVIGVMVTQSDQLAAFDESDLVVLQAVADQAAVAIENARLFDAEQRRAEQFRVISEVGSRVASILTVEELLGQMARLIQKSFDYYLVEIGLVEGGDLVFKTRASRIGADPFESFRLPVDKQSITGLVAATGEPLLVADVSQEPRYVEVTSTETRSELAVPMKAKEKVIGVINVQSERIGAFDPSDLSVLQSLASQAAIAIENARLYEQAQRLAVFEERQRLARELHDAVTQTLFSASLISEALPELWESDQEEGRQLLAELRRLSRGALAEMRTLLLELRPAVLAEANLAELLHQLGEAVAGRTGADVLVQVQVCDRPSDQIPVLSSDVRIALYRITQETLNNVVKHASAGRVAVRLRCNPPDAGVDGQQPTWVALQVEDDGRGFDPGCVPPDRLGLGIIRERAQAIGADLEIESQPGQGTRVTVTWQEES